MTGPDPTRQFDELDAAERDDEAAQELERLKRQMVHNETLFVRDITLSPKIKERALANVHLVELEDVLQKLNQRFPIAKDPRLHAAVRAIREVITETPELTSYVTAILNEGKNNVHFNGELQSLLRNIEITTREYARRLSSLSGVNMHAKLVEVGNLRARIVRILEQIPDPAISKHSNRVRIRVDIAGEAQIHGPVSGPASGEHLNEKIFRVLNAYLGKLSRFITHMTKNPDASGINHIGYDLVEHQRITNIVQKIEQKNENK